MFDSVILIGPGTNLFPITNSSLKITNLPIINTELLLINIKFLLPVSRKIYIIILEQDVSLIAPLINFVNVPIEIIGIDYYDGTVQQLLKLEKRLKSDNIIVTKGDLVTNIDIRTISNDFLENQTTFLTIFTPSENNAVCGFSNDELIFYSRNDNYNLETEIFLKRRINFTKEIDSLQFYMFKKDIFKYLTSEMFSFRSNLFPVIVDRLRNVSPVKIFNPMDNYIFQISSPQSYIDVLKFLKLKSYTDSENLLYSNDMLLIMKQYIKKTKLKDTKNIIGDDVLLDGGFIVNSILGNNVFIKSKAQVMSSILMNDIVIGENCFIENCVIGNNVTIPDNSKLIKCTVSPSYKFLKSVTAEQDTFSCN